jgi:hypothetical protein
VWIDNEKCGSWKMARLTGARNDTIIKDFKNGWIPQDDGDWKRWKNKNKL